MKRLFAYLLLAVVTVATVVPPEAAAARRTVVRHRPHRTVVVVRHGFPVRRVVTRTVVVHPVRRTVVVRSAPVFLPVVLWSAAVVSLPPRDALVWQDAETIGRDENWVDFTLGADSRGDALYMQLDGRAQIAYAEVTFGNGEVQVVDFRDNTRGPGIYKVLDFRDGREVSDVRMMARAKSEQATFRLLLAR